MGNLQCTAVYALLLLLSLQQLGLQLGALHVQAHLSKCNNIDLLATHQPIQALTIILNGNNLTGPALPDAWLQPGAMSKLLSLDVGSNPVAGALTANLSWPKLTLL